MEDKIDIFGGVIITLMAPMALMVLGGWILNIIKMFGMLGGDVSAMLIARIVGIILAPLGAILGYL